MPPQQNPTLDPKVLKVLRGIRTIESNGDYNAIGDNGASAGAFQWNNNKIKLQPGQMPARFLDHAKEANVQVSDFSKGSQNKVAYSIMKKWKDEGLQPEEIAAKWNGAHVDPSTGRLAYNQPEYGVKFRNALKGTSTPQQQQQQQQSVPTQQPEQAQQPDNLATQLNKRGAQFMNPGQGEDRYFGESVLGRAGAVLGGIGDVAGAIVNPLIKGTVNAISDIDAVQKFAGSAPVSKGLDIVNAGMQGAGEDYKQFEENNPKTGRFLRDAGNVASALPIGKGVQMTKNAAISGTKGVARTILPNASEKIMNGVARLTKTQADEFATKFGESHGKYLSRTGNMNAPEQIVENEFKKLRQTLADKDAALASLPGKFKDTSVTNALKELLAKEERIGISNDVTDTINNLARKHETEGLTMTEINNVKQLLEKNKIDYFKQNLPDSVERIRRIDKDLYKWQDMQAKRLGLKNLPELSRQIRMSHFVANKLGKSINGKVGNNNITLTDWIILSGMDPSSIAGFLAKKALLSTKAKTSAARLFAKKAEGPTVPEYGGKTGLPALIKGRDYSTPKVAPKPVNLPQSIRETNIGTDELRNAKIRDTGIPQKLLPERAGAIQLPSRSNQLPLEKPMQAPQKIETLKSSSIIPQKGTGKSGLMSTSKIARIKDPKKLSDAIEKKYGIKNAEFIAEDVAALRKEGGLTDKQIENFIKESIKKYD